MPHPKSSEESRRAMRLRRKIAAHAASPVFFEDLNVTATLMRISMRNMQVSLTVKLVIPVRHLYSQP